MRLTPAGKVLAVALTLLAATVVLIGAWELRPGGML